MRQDAKAASDRLAAYLKLKKRLVLLEDGDPTEFGKSNNPKKEILELLNDVERIVQSFSVREIKYAHAIFEKWREEYIKNKGA